MPPWEAVETLRVEVERKVEEARSDAAEQEQRWKHARSQHEEKAMQRAAATHVSHSVCPQMQAGDEKNAVALGTAIQRLEVCESAAPATATIGHLSACTQ